MSHNHQAVEETFEDLQESAETEQTVWMPFNGGRTVQSRQQQTWVVSQKRDVCSQFSIKSHCSGH